MVRTLNDGKATAPEAAKLIEELRRLIEEKGLNVELVEKSDVTGQSVLADAAADDVPVHGEMVK